MSVRKYWIGFNHIAGVGPQRMKLLCEHFPSLEAAWHADSNALRQAGLDRRTIDNLIAARAELNLTALQHSIDELGAAALTLQDKDYPPLLQELPDAPPVLYVKGTLTKQDRWAVAIVGTRKASHYGKDMAYQLARDLAHEGVTVISGLAVGIDAAAHLGALDAGGRTIAVLPCGIDSIYPPEHHRLASRIINSGALITEFPPGTLAEAKNFPARNRIISGLALGVVVAEAPAKSGALLTADSAAEQGREVFAVPGHTTNAASKGSNRLIQDGAKLIMGVDDILSELNLTRETVETREQVAQIAPQDEMQAMILGVLGSEPLHIDEICRKVNQPVDRVSSTLAIMELMGMVRQSGSMQYTTASGPASPYMLD